MYNSFETDKEFKFAYYSCVKIIIWFFNGKEFCSYISKNELYKYIL